MDQDTSRAAARQVKKKKKEATQVKSLVGWQILCCCLVVGVNLIEEHLREVRCLRQRLEESIRTNERLRQQLEERLATTGRDGGNVALTH